MTSRGQYGLNGTTIWSPRRPRRKEDSIAEKTSFEADSAKNTQESRLYTPYR